MAEDDQAKYCPCDKMPHLGDLFSLWILLPTATEPFLKFMFFENIPSLLYIILQSKIKMGCYMKKIYLSTHSILEEIVLKNWNSIYLHPDRESTVTLSSAVLSELILFSVLGWLSQKSSFF